MIRVVNLSKSYLEKRVLLDLNFEVSRGEIFAIIGPSGVGKTTLLRIINMLEKPSQGEIYFNGRKIEENSLLLRRKMGMVFQNPVVFNSSVFENVAYGLKVRGLKREIIRDRVEKALKIVGLEGFERKNAPSLSGGEIQRTNLASVMVLEPELLILDEPTANLDPTNVRLIEEAVLKANREYNSTIILATHNMFQARRLAHRVMFLLDGRAIEISTKKEIFEKPRNEVTLAFIRGEMVY
jgi:tungstate transport system ATP-binding protein